MLHNFIDRLSHPRALLALIGVTLALMGASFGAWAMLRPDIASVVCRNYRALERIINAPPSVDTEVLEALDLRGPGGDTLIRRIAERQAQQLALLGQPPSHCPAGG